ncbi:carbohydrate-binding module family 18 protein [Xylariaceae sp. FL0255]|nr:carbohydrate-binding module family 18 protein [Xylariaceae sp. FL0255]
MHLSKFLVVAGTFMANAGVHAEFRNVMYYDVHPYPSNKTSDLDDITHVITAFVDPMSFSSKEYSKFKNSSFPTGIPTVEYLRNIFPNNSTKMGISLGGWGPYSLSFSTVSTSDQRDNFAANLADWMDNNSYDFVDIDWEYPGGGGDPEPSDVTAKADIVNFAPFLQSIKSNIKDKNISLTLAGTEVGMAAFFAPRNETHIQNAWDVVEFATIMAYDFVNRDSSYTGHHTDIAHTYDAVIQYLAFGLKREQINLGFAFYAKWFQTIPDCAEPLDCALVPPETPNRTDTGKSGVLTFREASLQATINYSHMGQLLNTTNGVCGINANGTLSNFKCLPGDCCSSDGWCGHDDSHCQGCQPGFGDCTGPNVPLSFQKAQKNSITDTVDGGVYYWDNATVSLDNTKAPPLFWTWETPDMMKRKYEQIIFPLGLGGVTGWSLGEDDVSLNYTRTMNWMVKNATSAS